MLGDLVNPMIEERRHHELLPPDEALRMFMNYAAGGVLLGHNADYDYPKGRLTAKVAPLPSPSLSALTVPPCSSTSWRTMESPSPMPPWTLLVRESAWRKRSKTCGRNSPLMPMPES